MNRTHPLRPFLALGVLAAPLGLFAAGPAQAASTTYYVSPSGSDTNSGTSESAPLKTLQKAADRTKPGDTVSIMGGTYTESAPGRDILVIKRSGTAGQPITYRAHPGSKPVIHPVNSWNGVNVAGASHIVISGLEIAGDSSRISLADAERNAGRDDPRYNTNCLNIHRDGDSGPAPHDVLVTGNEVHHCPGAGISAIDADEVTVDHNKVHDTSWYTHYATSGISFLRALDASPGDPQKYKMRITGNVVYGNETKVKWGNCGCYSDGNGIIVDTNQNKPEGTGADYQGRTLVANNVTFDNGGSGIHSFKSQHVDIVNNTAYYNSRSPHLDYGNIYAAYSRDVRLLNNVSSVRPGEPTNSNGKNEDVTYDYNVYFGGKTPEVKGPHDLVADPRLVHPTTDPAAADFRPGANSPALGSGTPFPAVPQDITGRDRDSAQGWDRGAYAKGATAQAGTPGAGSAPAASAAPGAAGTTGAKPQGRPSAQGETAARSAQDGTPSPATPAPATPAPGAHDSLASTGFDAAPALTGVAALAAGAGLLLWRRRKPGGHARSGS
ncbi:DUF1565 domain-containing protein [Streptomyces sp. NPDC049954]|uniref:right-handed parallel beta-helix repeat-containing protein n=1 Tax=Streptomyces sp. NPDC049954 TaxID=3155779 RepID=UPI00343B6DBC